MAAKPPKEYFTPEEAAKVLGLTPDQFRVLVRKHIAKTEDDMVHVHDTVYHLSDLFVLRWVTGQYPGANIEAPESAPSPAAVSEVPVNEPAVNSL